MTKKRAIEMLTNMRNNYDAYGKLTGKDEITQMLDMAIEALQEQKVGKWIGDNGKEVYLDEFGNTKHSCHCSVCGDWLVASDEYGCRGRYCPNCGAKMEGAEE